MSRLELREAEGRRLEVPASSTTSTPDVAPGTQLVCATCGVPITSWAERRAVEGAHEHVRVNPHGLTFRVGCFAAAHNLAAVGPLEHFFSWFAGYGWRVECCAACGTHLGWRFESDTDLFHGLILDRLAEAGGPVAH